MEDEIDKCERMVREEREAYNKFMKLRDEGDIEEAYGVFRRKPMSIEYFRLYEFCDSFFEIRKYIGKKEAFYFRARFFREAKKRTIDDVPIIDDVISILQNGFLEEMLEELSPEAKKNLEEMGND